MAVTAVSIDHEMSCTVSVIAWLGYAALFLRGWKLAGNIIIALGEFFVNGLLIEVNESGDR